jgi:hypothetical protein
MTKYDLNKLHLIEKIIHFVSLKDIPAITVCKKYMPAWNGNLGMLYGNMIRETYLRIRNIYNEIADWR